MRILLYDMGKRNGEEKGVGVLREFWVVVIFPSRFLAPTFATDQHRTKVPKVLYCKHLKYFIFLMVVCEVLTGIWNQIWNLP